jgi:hypothetical protein
LKNSEKGKRYSNHRNVGWVFSYALQSLFENAVFCYFRRQAPIESIMNPYKFQTAELGISNTGIHLLRSNFNYKTIEFSTIDEIRIQKGRQVNNWAIALLFGVALISVALYVLYHVLYEYFVGTQVHRFYITQFIFPVLPLFAGVYCLFVSLKTGMVLTITSNNKIKNLPIETLKKTKKLEELIAFLKANELTEYKFRNTHL